MRSTAEERRAEGERKREEILKRYDTYLENDDWWHIYVERDFHQINVKNALKLIINNSSHMGWLQPSYQPSNQKSKSVTNRARVRHLIHNLQRRPTPYRINGHLYKQDSEGRSARILHQYISHKKELEEDHIFLKLDDFLKTHTSSQNKNIAESILKEIANKRDNLKKNKRFKKLS